MRPAGIGAEEAVGQQARGQRDGVDVEVAAPGRLRLAPRIEPEALEVPGERDERAQPLEAALPREYWVEINRLLVPFGKHVCTGVAPKCSTCPLLDMCRQVGVTEHR